MIQPNVNKSSFLPVWSPDGSKLAFTSNRTGNNDIWVMNADGTDQHRVTDGKHHYFYPSWSPDGQKLTFQGLIVEDERGKRRVDYDIFVCSQNGKDIRQITDDPFDQEQPIWSPDGSRILYKGEIDDGQWGGPEELYTITPDGKQKVQLTHNDAYEFQAAWSPDGSRIAFVSTRDTQEWDDVPRYELYVMDKDGGNQTRVTHESDGAFNPAWSPDGSRLAFTQGRKNSQIGLIGADGSGREVLTDLPNENQWPEWSPDGKTIAFSSMRRNITFEMRTVPADGGPVTSLLQDSKDERLPEYSPDGRTIAFSATRDGDGMEDVFACDADGSNLRRLTPYPEPASSEPGAPANGQASGAAAADQGSQSAAVEGDALRSGGTGEGRQAAEFAQASA